MVVLQRICTQRISISGSSSVPRKNVLQFSLMDGISRGVVLEVIVQRLHLAETRRIVQIGLVVQHSIQLPTNIQLLRSLRRELGTADD